MYFFVGGTENERGSHLQVQSASACHDLVQGLDQGAGLSHESQGSVTGALAMVSQSLHQQEVEGRAQLHMGHWDLLGQYPLHINLILIEIACISEMQNFLGDKIHISVTCYPSTDVAFGIVNSMNNAVWVGLRRISLRNINFSIMIKILG